MKQKKLDHKKRVIHAGTASHETIVVKVGTNMLMDAHGFVMHERLRSLTQQIVHLSRAGHAVILVTSGAVAMGKSVHPVVDAETEEVRKQVWAAVGQPELMHAYAQLFLEYRISTAQVLVTTRDFTTAVHKKNLLRCVTAALKSGIIPILNENDVTATQELMFTDNDELAYRIATLLKAQRIIILSKAGGFFTKDPSSPGAERIARVLPQDRMMKRFVATSRTSHGRGGMATKYHFSTKAARQGMHVHIAALSEHVLMQCLSDDDVGTHFIPYTKSTLR
ncbi:MAG: glutamate 5-kinase [Candidatus Parcubacteria bacterium]|jgi:glutamate 5-kinase